MTLSYNLSHHGGNSTHALWIKYFTIKSEVKDEDIHLQTPIDQFLISIFNYQPIDIRAVKKEIKKSHNQTELEQNLAQLFLFNEINIGNAFAFSKILSEKITSCSTPTNLDLIPQYLIRGYIVFSYRFHELIDKYLNKEQMENFQAEYWELFHYPLQYLLKEPNTIFKETIPILLPILSNINVESIINLDNSDFLKIGFNSFLSTLINSFPLELECGTSHLLDFLIQALNAYSNMLSNLSNISGIVDLFGLFFSKLNSVSNQITDEQAQKILTIFTNVMKTISSHHNNANMISLFNSDINNINNLGNNNDNTNLNTNANTNSNTNDDENSSTANMINNTKSFLSSIINFTVHSFNCIPSFLPKYTKEQIDEIIHSIISYLLWITDTIPYEKMFNVVGEYHIFTFETKDIKYNDWISYFKGNILLPEKFTKQIKSIRVQNVINALDSFFKNSLPLLSAILDNFSGQISSFNDSKKYLILVFILISLIMIKNIDTSNISQAFLSTCIYESAFPTNLTVEIQPIALHYHEVYLKFLYYFCHYKEENIQAVLKVLSKSLINEDFEKMRHFLPLLRSLLLHDPQLHFIHYFLESGIIENLHSFLFISTNEALIDQIASFYQLISITRPMEVFHSSSFLLALRNLVLINRLQPLLAPCFKIGLSLSYTTPFNIGKQCVYFTLEQVFSILKQALTDDNAHDLAIELVTYLIDQVNLIDVSVFNDFYAMFEVISKLPSFIPTSDAFLKCLKFLNKFCAHFPQFLRFVNSNNSVIIRNFDSVSPKIKITQEIIDCLIAFMLNSTEIKESKIKNRAALRLLLQISKGTEFENSVLNFLLKTCRNSMFNNFECFSCDVIGFVLDRLANHLELSLELFKVIGSKFFSPLALNQTFKAMRLVEGQRCKHQQKLLDTFLSMLIDCRPSPVNSFFHFGGDGEGVVVKNLDPVIFSEPYSIATIFKIEKFEEKFYPILTITENCKNSLLSFFMKSDMFVIQYNQHPGYVLRKNFVDSNWYKLVIVIHPAIIQIFINDAELSSLQIAKHDFRNEVNVTFGMKDQKSFDGDFGPTIFIKSTNLQEINEIYQKVNLSRIHMKSTFINFLPWHVKNDTINDVVVDNDSYQFLGDAIPSCKTIAQMIYFEGTFQKFLPLFILLNYPLSKSGNEEDLSDEFINGDERFFVTVLLTFENLLKISEKLQKSFEKIDGFRLFAGFMSHIKSELFTAKIANQLESIFNILTLKSLQSEMIEQIWLNFNLWSSMSFEFQTTFYSILDKIWKKNQSFMTSKITPSLLLYRTQLTFSEIQKTKRKLIRFDLDEQIDNTPVELTAEEKFKIKNLQWKFVLNYTMNNPTVPTIMDILMIFSFHSSPHTQNFASEIIEISLKTNLNELNVAFELIDEYEFFLNIFANSKNVKLRANLMRCILLLGVNERNEKTIIKTMKFKQAILILIQLIITKSSSDKEKLILFKICFNFLFDNFYSAKPKQHEILNPEALMLLFILSSYMQREELVKYSIVLLNDFATFSNSISFLFTFDSWPIWSFIFAFNCYDIEEDYHTFAYFFSIFFNSSLTKGRIDFINSFMFFLDLIKMYTNADFNSIKKETIMLLILFAVQHKLNFDVLVNLLIVALRFLFFEITFDSNLNQQEKLNNKFLLNLISKLQSSSSIDEIQNQKDSFRIVFKDVDDSNADFVIEVLSIISGIIELNPEEQIEFDGILLNVFDLFSYLYSVLDKSDIESIKIRAQGYFAQVSEAVSPAVLDKFTTFSKEEFFNFFQRPDIVRESYHSSLVNETIKISSSLKQMLQTTDDLDRISQSFKKFEASFNCFIEANLKQTLLTSLIHDNMMVSFIRYVTSSNGPWSTTLDLSKSSSNRWRATTKINDYGYNFYWKLNRNFDDHKKASLLRDSMKITSEDEQKLDIIPNFHRILIQNSPLSVLARTEKNQEKTTSFKVTQFTLLHHISGNIYVNDRRIFFDGSEFVENLGNPEQVVKDRPHKFIEIRMSRVSFVFQRRHQHCDVGAEIFTTSNKSYFFIFESKEKRTDFLEIMKKMTLKNSQLNSIFSPLQIACGCCSQTISCSDLVSKSKITKMWQERKITNFLYLLYLNLISGRSFNDISQYPVFPWILSDYSSEKIDLNDPSIYRDLSKPIGAYNEERLDALKKNMNMEDPFQRCLYRTFFSNPSSVAGYLIRTEPFTSLHIRLQGGKFDLPTRLFTSVKKAWESVTGKLNDFRELIPEFFCSDHFLINENGFDLGKKVNDVELPCWASSPHEFITMNRIALESEFVSSQLENWIDLIFGVNQISVDKNNIFHLFSYTDSLPPDITEDPEMFDVAQNHALNFGVCPNKLFKESHPPRNVQQPPLTVTHSTSSSNFTQKVTPGKVPSRTVSSTSLQTLSNEGPNIPSNSIQQAQSQQTVFDLSKRDTSFESNRSPFQLPVLDAPVACIRKGCVLTTKPTLFNIQQNSVQHFTSMRPIKEGHLIDFDGTFLFEVSRGGTYVSVVSIKTSEEVGILPHNNYEVTCISCVENRAILVCGADCSIDIWKAEASSSTSAAVSDFSSSISSPSETAAVAVGNSIVFLGTISSHSMPIVAVVGNFYLDIVISIDVGSIIVISTLRERKFIHTFKVDCASNSVHFLKVLNSGMIVLSAHVPGEVNSSIFFFDLCGNVLNRIQIDSCIEALEIINTKDMQEFVVVSTSSKSIVVYECSDFRVIFNITSQIVPRFISFIDQEQRAILVVKPKQKRQELAVIEF